MRLINALCRFVEMAEGRAGMSADVSHDPYWARMRSRGGICVSGCRLNLWTLSVLGPPTMFRACRASATCQDLSRTETYPRAPGVDGVQILADACGTGGEPRFPAHEVNVIRSYIGDYLPRLLEAWDEHCGS